MYALFMWSFVKVIAFLALCYAAITAWVYFSQRRLLYFPTRSHVATPADIELAYEDVWLTNSLGTRIHGWWIPHENPRFTLLFAHGNGGNVSHRLESFRIFHDLGLSVLIYDYSGYGQSDGQLGEKETRSDAQAAWDWLVDKKGIPADSIVLFGRSLGGAVAAGLAADLGRGGVYPVGLILESTFTSVPDMAARLYPWLPVRQLATFKYNSMADLSLVRLPALFAHSPADDIVPFENGHRLYDSYAGPKTFLEMLGDHNSGYVEMGQAYVDGLNDYLMSLERES